ncbi:MAG: UDP-N-acetylmuramoyl-tripeptide--D-alanyl-D-alanine ligase [Clostridia bacterium]|nr:UDP-N-acetylmuramoyl-tripeptide--D-alanyl-D-alanine ligase [Clostridia bacterium]
MRIRLGIPMQLSEIARATQSILNQSNDALITNISTDTRDLQKGDLFIAIKGKNYNGEDFLSTARMLGAYTLSSSKDSDIICNDSLDALLNLASYYAKKLPNILYKIAITGSVGKTTTKEFTKILLSTRYKVHSSSGNYNNEIGMPMSILSADADTEILLMEMGMNHRGEISRMSNCLCPNIALITNIGTAHIGNLGSREEIVAAKMEIRYGMSDGILILPYDEPLLKKYEPSYSFSDMDAGADFYLKSDDKNDILIYYKQNLLCVSKFKLMEKHHLSCLLAALSIAISAGVDPDSVSRGISLISNDNTRQTTIYKKGIHFYLDCYNASYESMIACIRSAESALITGHKHLLLGDILELGDMAEEIHYNVGRNISRNVFDYLFLFGSHAGYIAKGAISNGFPIERIIHNADLSSPEKTAEQIKLLCSVGDTVFLKASRSIRLERVVDHFFKE